MWSTLNSYFNTFTLICWWLIVGGAYIAIIFSVLDIGWIPSPRVGVRAHLRNGMPVQAHSRSWPGTMGGGSEIGCVSTPGMLVSLSFWGLAYAAIRPRIVSFQIWDQFIATNYFSRLSERFFPWLPQLIWPVTREQLETGDALINSASVIAILIGSSIIFTLCFLLVNLLLSIPALLIGDELGFLISLFIGLIAALITIALPLHLWSVLAYQSGGTTSYYGVMILTGLPAIVLIGAKTFINSFV